MSSEAPSSSSRTVAAMCSRSHGTPPNCSACVVSCSATQRSSWSGSASSAVAAWPEVGRHEQQPRRAGGVEHGELVLAEHAPGEEAGDRAGLGAQQHAAGGADDPAERAGALAELLGHRVQHAAHRAEVGVGPLVAADGLGAGIGADGTSPV